MEGETPVCFNREFSPKLDPEFVAKADEKKIRYIRNYGNRENTSYMTWQTIFNTESRKVLWNDYRKFTRIDTAMYFLGVLYSKPISFSLTLSTEG